ncbi:N-acetylneuraminate synthase family protein [Limisalsivibrio acetivorans]|uniref:N-acetylneuraminate synthase family protein n=1 Tax=Limisalsivibrio acetivorans TaxID=1304888 RepID=UPI0003B50BF8|nr:N-acetylneuraminate synthase family protein [Limisalsivibrio acetivorans]
MKILDVFAEHDPFGPVFKRPYLIAEAGVNHEGSMETAKRLIDQAGEAGADGIKFQTYKAATIASKDSPYYWDITKEPTKSQYELFQKYDRFWKEEYEQLKLHCDRAGIEFMSTPFDRESAFFLNELMDVFKISSSDITNKPFIQLIAGFGKPVILSTGAAYLHEIEEAVSWITEKGVPLSLLHCVLNYPTDDENAHLAMISCLRRKYPEHVTGYSDHTLPKDMKVLEAAALLGAHIIEKHFTHDKTLPGNDHYHAMDKEDIKVYKNLINRLETLAGNYDKKPLESEDTSRRNARRSLVAAKKIAAGRKITAGDLTWKRPAHGISPRYMDDVVGMTAAEDIDEDTVMQWKMFK